MQPRIETLAEKKVVGKRIRTSLANNKTYELWQSFMPHRREIKNKVTTDLLSIQVYDPSFDMKDFTQETEFEKWAAVEVTDFDSIPNEMESYTITGGLYAVFLHIGAADTGPKTFQYIFGTWLPNSDYTLDNRAHFEVLGAKYKNNDPASEEEIWIPIKSKA
jgi:AraC family transcriptional regulator